MIPAPGPQNPAWYFAAARRRNSYTSAFSPSDCSRSARGLARLDQMVAVNAGGNGYPLAPALHELQDARLAEEILEDDPVGPQQQIALARSELLALRVVEMSEQHFLRQGERPAQAAAHSLESALHGAVNTGRHLRGRFDAGHRARLASVAAAVCACASLAHNAFIQAIDAVHASMESPATGRNRERALENRYAGSPGLHRRRGAAQLPPGGGGAAHHADGAVPPAADSR